MNEKQQNKSVMLAVVAFALVVLVVGAIGYFTIGTAKEEIQGEIEVEEYRVSSKVPGRILELCVKEGDYVKAGDTLAILDSPEIKAKKAQAESADDAAQALSDMAQAGRAKSRYAALMSFSSRQKRAPMWRRKAMSAYKGCLTRVL